MNQCLDGVLVVYETLVRAVEQVPQPPEVGWPVIDCIPCCRRGDDTLRNNQLPTRISDRCKAMAEQLEPVQPPTGLSGPDGEPVSRSEVENALSVLQREAGLTEDKLKELRKAVSDNLTVPHPPGGLPDDGGDGGRKRPFKPSSSKRQQLTSDEAAEVRFFAAPICCCVCPHWFLVRCILCSVSCMLWCRVCSGVS